VSVSGMVMGGAGIVTVVAVAAEAVMKALAVAT
jgi:hypothetical protein